MPTKINEIGNRHGKLIVMSEAGRSKTGFVKWNCQCDCGNSTIVIGTSLRAGTTKSCGCLHKLPFGEAALNHLMGSYKTTVKRRNLTWALDKESFKKFTSSNCYYCGTNPERKYQGDGRRHGSYSYNGIDRKDNNKGYTVENCVSCCKYCNHAKGILNEEEFYLWINRVCTNLHNRRHVSDRMSVSNE